MSDRGGEARATRAGVVTHLLGIGAVGVALLLATFGIAVAVDNSAYPDLVPGKPERVTAPHEITFNGETFLGVTFDGFVLNVGSGALDVAGDPSAGAMFQRVFDGSEWVPVASPSVIYETADGHDHWHLMRVARYSLWTEDRSFEVAPASKVGFCLVDSQVIPGFSDPAPKFYDSTLVKWCNSGEPQSTDLRMGISPGWRDMYTRDVALQWIDVSDVPPGRYVVSSEADPDDAIAESDESNNAPVFADEVTIIPGYVAQPVGPVAVSGADHPVALSSAVFGSPGPRAFRIVEVPAHGSLDVAVGVDFTNTVVTYTPDPGYQGPDQFRYVALDLTSPYPRTPPAAAVALDVVGGSEVGVTISGAPASLDAGTGVQLSAIVTNAPPDVIWAVDGAVGGNATVGTIDATGFYLAPEAVPPAGVVTIRATSTTDPAAFDEVVIVIDPASRPPVLEDPGPQTSDLGRPASLQLVATDPDGDMPFYDAGNLPPGLSINHLTGRITGTPTQEGSWVVTASASDGVNTVTVDFTWTVTVAPPVITPPSPVSVDEGDTAMATFTVTDPAGLPVSVSVSGPDFVSVDGGPETWSLTVTPDYVDSGNHTVVITAVNDAGAVASVPVGVSVVEVNRVPVVSVVGSVVVDEGGVVSVPVSVVDPDGDGVVVSVSGVGFVSLGGVSGAWELVVAPGFEDSGSWVVDVVADDGRGGVVSVPVGVSVVEVNRVPVVSVSKIDVEQGETVSMALAASDPDGDELDVSVVGLPTGIAYDAATKRFVGVAEEVGIFHVDVVVDDGRGGLAATTFDWWVHVPHNAPPVPIIWGRTTIEMGPGKFYLDARHSFDPEGARLTYRWDLDGDRSFDDAFGPTLTVVALGPGAYPVAVLVTDEDGRSAGASVTLVVAGSGIDGARLVVLPPDPGAFSPIVGSSDPGSSDPGSSEPASTAPTAVVAATEASADLVAASRPADTLGVVVTSAAPRNPVPSPTWGRWQAARLTSAGLGLL